MKSKVCYFKNGECIDYDERDGDLEVLLSDIDKKNKHNTLKLEDFDNIKITKENRCVFQSLLYSKYGFNVDEDNLFDKNDKYEYVHRKAIQKDLLYRFSEKLFQRS